MTNGRRTIGAVLALACLWAVPSGAQVPVDAVHTPDTITADEDTVVITNLPGGRGTAAIQVSGYCSCTLVIEGRSYLTGDWETVEGAPTIDADGIYFVTASGLASLRVRADAYSSGTTTIAMRVSSAGGGSSGGGSGGEVTNGGTFVVQENGAALTSLQAIEAAVESTITVEIDPDTLSDPAVHGNAVATAPDGIPVMCEAKDVDGGALPNVVTEGQFARPACVLNGAQLMVLIGEGGTVDLGSAMHTNLALVAGATATEDSASINARTIMMIGAERRDTAASSADTAGEAATFGTDALGLAWTRTLDPCSGVAKQYLPIDIVTATTTEITASLAGASNHYYVCSINLGPTAGAQNVALVDDDSDNCGSVTSGVAGGTTAGEGWNAAANGGIAFGNGASSIARTNGTNRVLCLVTSAAVQVSGVITVVAAP